MANDAAKSSALRPNTLGTTAFHESMNTNEAMNSIASVTTRVVMSLVMVPSVVEFIQLLGRAINRVVTLATGDPPVECALPFYFCPCLAVWTVRVELNPPALGTRTAIGLREPASGTLFDDVGRVGELSLPLLLWLRLFVHPVPQFVGRLVFPSILTDVSRVVQQIS
jgi:hypothetical protein